MTPSEGDQGSAPVTLALVNDHRVVVEHLREMLAPFSIRVAVADMEVDRDDVAPADVVLFGTLGDQRHALARARDLVERRARSRVVVYAHNPSPRFVREAHEVGVAEVIDSSVTGERLVAMIEAVSGRSVGHRRTRQFRRVPPDVRSARGFAADALRALGANDSEIETFGLAVSELGSNAVMHARHSGWTVGIEADDEWYTMDVSGGTAGPDNIIFHPDQWAIAEADEPTGRGLGIVQELMDDVTVETHLGTARVVCRLRRSCPSPTR